MENNEVLDFYKSEVERMEKMGYTSDEIERALDSMIRVQNMVMLAVV